MFDENNIKIFSSRDQIRNQLIDYAKSYLQLENVDINNANYLGYLINVISALTSNLLYYNSSVWREFFLTKAIQKESVINLATMLGYTADLATPASCSVLLEIPLSFTENTSLNFTFHGINEITMNNSTITPMKFYADGIPFSVKYTTKCNITNNNGVYTADIFKESYLELNSKNASNIPYTIDDNNVLRFYVETLQIDTLKGTDLEFVFDSIRPFSFYTKDINFSGDLSDIRLYTRTTNVDTTSNNLGPNSQRWNLYNSLYLIPENEYGFSYKKTDQGIRLFFGNGIIGKQPTAGQLCQIMLNITQGSKGNIIQGVINKSDRVSVYNSTGSQVGSLKFNAINMEPAFGGKNSPKIDDIRSEAIAQVAVNKKLVTKYDYDYMRLVLDAEDLNINSSISILKRSDISRNEINLFTDLIYHTIDSEHYVVPTRNVKVTLETDGGANLLLRSGDVIYTDELENEYISMFNILINPEYKESRYYYTINNVSKPFVMTRALDSKSFISITSCDFLIEKSETLDEDKLTFKLFYSIFNNDPSVTIIPTQLSAQVRLPNGDLVILDNEPIDQYFSMNAEQLIYLRDIDFGEVDFVFYIYDTLSDNYTGIPTTIDELETSSSLIGSVSAIIKEDLSEFMYSRIAINNEYTLDPIIIYDVPALDKVYYDSIDKSLFDNYVLNKIITFDVTKYRMLTDFLNLKFSNTTGKVHNMRHNATTKTPVHTIDPTTLPDNTTPVGARYAVSKIDNPWNVEPWNRVDPFIATRVNYGSNWIFEELAVNDYIYVHMLGKNMLFNGEIFVDPFPDIPLEIEIVVWTEFTEMKDSEDLVDTIKKALIDNFYPKFGYDKPIYISEITRVVKSVFGVKNCKVLKPLHDIQFLYDIYNDLTKEELLEYTPELIYFDTSTIQIELR